MSVARRIQRKRTKGWKMPDGAVYVGRPTKFGNPFKVGVFGDAERCVAAYREGILRDPRFVELITRELRGKDLACFCRLDQPCHADVLLEIANSAEERTHD